MNDTMKSGSENMTHTERLSLAYLNMKARRRALMRLLLRAVHANHLLIAKELSEKVKSCDEGLEIVSRKLDPAVVVGLAF